jgi:heme/copper-type cytochrome/quinol oxidase subunit 2
MSYVNTQPLRYKRIQIRIIIMMMMMMMMIIIIIIVVVVGFTTGSREVPGKKENL